MLRTAIVVAAIAFFPTVSLAGESAWWKLCENPAAAATGEQSTICGVYHDRIGPKGTPLISAAVRDVDGDAKKRLVVKVPVGHSQKAGLKLGIYPQAQWEKAKKNEKVAESELHIFKMSFSGCDADMCTAETDVTDETMELLRSGGGIMVLALLAGKPVGYPVPLDGFASSLAEPPKTRAEYDRARQEKIQEMTKSQQ